MNYPTERQLSVRTLPWLTVTTAAGREQLGLEETLLRAHQISRIEVVDPLARHAILQFLVSITALLGRELQLDSDTASSVVTEGFPAKVVRRVLDRLDDRLWLIHPDTPFLQEKRFMAITEASGRSVDDAAIHAAAIDSAVPGASSKAWWNVPGDVFKPTSLTPVEAVQVLLKVWFHAPGGRAAIGAFGSRTALGSTLKVKTFLWWRGGEKLSHLLLANLDEEWLDGDDLPGWAQDLEDIVEDIVGGPYSSFVQCTQSCSTALLLSAERAEGEPIYFDRALYGGSPRNGLDATDKDDLKEFKGNWKKQLDAAALWNPRVPRFRKKVGDELKANNELRPEMAHLQNLLSWYREDRRPKLRHGVFIPDDNGIDALVLEMELSGSYPEIKQVTWFALGRGFIDLTEQQYGQVRAYLNDVPKHAAEKLKEAVHAAFSQAQKNAQHVDAIADAVVERFYLDAERVLEAAFESVLAGKPYSPGTERQLCDLMVGAFSFILAPYISVRTLPDIAEQRGVLYQTRFKPFKPFKQDTSPKGKK